MVKLTRFIVVASFILWAYQTQAQVAPDTIHIQTFTFGSSQNDWFAFPPDTVQVNKIIMYYKLKCNPLQNPACGEWDYQTSTYLYEHTGVPDSNLLNTASYVVNGSSPDSLQAMFQQSWTYFPVFDAYPVYTDTIAFDSAALVSGVMSIHHPFNSEEYSSRSQYLWTYSELTAAGLQAGNITALRFRIDTSGSDLNGIKVRLKNSTLDTLSQLSHEETGWTDSYTANLVFADTGWNSFAFPYLFNWDGSSNIAMDVSFSNSYGGADNVVRGGNTGSASGITCSANDKSLFFEGADYISVPAQAFAAVDSFITVAFWQYGNPLYQPQDQSTFEGNDSQNRRVINAHIPWSNGRVYWDCGNSGSGSYDRIDKAANPQDYEGKWNYWTFTKNVATGSMKIYLNGQLWHSGTGLTRRMYGMTNFKIGSFASGGYNYDGNIDEFAMWNAELDSATINQYMNRDLDYAHPFAGNLLFYYKFNEGTLTTAADSSGLGYDGALAGLPQYIPYAGSELFRNFIETQERPDLIFEQGSYTFSVDTVIGIDSIPKAPMQVIFFSDSLNPITPTDTMVVWPTYFNNYSYDSTGTATDSTWVFPDTTIYKKIWYYYSAPFEVVNRFEIGRYITPYGNGLSLGNGFTWEYDVSDYRTLLKDSVHLSAGNWQELLDMRFDFILGTPPRDPISVKNLWSGNYGYGANTENELTARTVIPDSSASGYRIKMRPTGHGFGGNQNCAEFCAKAHKITVDGVQRFSRLVWKDDCGVNPVYPQGGTWVYSRANWCPGDDVPTYDLELTPWVIPGDSVPLDYNIDAYTWNGQGSWPYYQIETQLVSYGAPNFIHDAELYDIKSPAKTDIYKRMNPVCNNPLVTIRNTGSDTLTSLTITYGIEGAVPSVFQWSGNLTFMQLTDVQLEQFDWNGSGKFYASVSLPNGQTDEYDLNNTQKRDYTGSPEYPQDIFIEVRTNNVPWENSYTVTNDAGNVVLSKTFSVANLVHKDTLHLPPGCYLFRLLDSDDDGLNWWAAPNDGSGSARIKNAITGANIKTFNSDFGSEIYQQFTIGYNLYTNEVPSVGHFEMYPNPVSDNLTIELFTNTTGKADLVVCDMTGRPVMEKAIDLQHEFLQLDFSNLRQGIYFISIRASEFNQTEKVIVTH